MASRIVRTGGVAELGGKGAALADLSVAGFPVPPWFAITPPDTGSTALLPDELRAEIMREVAALAPDGERLAVRSSATEEDSAEHSFAGQFESYLYVAPGDVPERALDVWRTASSERVAEYRRQRALTEAVVAPAVLVQRMVDADAAGVAFSADPVSGRRDVSVISAVYGVGSALVSGDVDADTYRVTRDGEIELRSVVHKATAERAGPDGPTTLAVSPELADRPALTDDQVRAVARLAADAERHFARPQDIEWAVAGGELFLLQSRPITSALAAPTDPDGKVALWDNSNIAESYGGMTTPLTYSFARYVYEEVYRQFCRIIGVADARIDRNADAFRDMLGFIRGRVYYNLVSWYRVLALLPGYRLNRSFMEQMMGVREGMPPEIEAQIDASDSPSKLGDAVSAIRTVAGLITAYRRLPVSIARFYARLEAALAGGAGLERQRADELVAHFRQLERDLLTRWDAPLVNDFFAMIFFGVLGKLTTSWGGDVHGTMQNDLVSGGGDIISAEPAKRIVHMAGLLASRPQAIETLSEGDPAAVRQALDQYPELADAFDDYVDVFGDRTLEELKLETITLGEDPIFLARSIGQLARARAGASASPAAERVDLRGDAAARALEAMKGHPIRRAIFRWVLGQARARIRDRENLRFERTRLFGRVRRIFVELGKRYTDAGALDDPRDIFYLTVDEALGGPGPEAGSKARDLRAAAAARRAELARYAELPAPPDRFQTRGAVANDTLLLSAPVGPAVNNEGEERQGIGCYPGVVRGLARVVRDPRHADLQPGEILVAERTDPGWVMLFPAAKGLLVERGSLLSHSAIVARELGLPAVVSVPGLTSWLSSGDEVELDGRAGTIRRLQRAEPAA